jgi:membrane-bound serine protease (ClpP class)
MKIKTGVILAVLIALLGSNLSIAQSQTSDVYIIDFNDIVHGVSADFIRGGIEEANAANASAIILKMQTPGGLITSMEAIIQSILASEVPVVGYVYPSGSKAASAGFYILMACDVAVMSPGTRTGSATPVMMTGGGSEGENENLKNMLEKVKGDSRAFIKSLIRGHLRNPDVDIAITEEKAVAAIDEGTSYTEKESLDFGLINFIASDIDDLVARLDGYEVRRFTIEGEEPEFATIRTKDADIVTVEMDFREEFLSYLSNPMIALFLGAIGVLGLYLEFSNPGLIFPGAVGAISLVLAAISFQILTVNWAGLILVLIAMVLFVLEMNIQSYGLLTIGGIICLVVGGIMLFEGPIPEMRLSIWQMLPFAIAIALVTLFLLRLVIKAHFGKVTTGKLGLEGAQGYVKNGKAYVHGEIWNFQRGLDLKDGDEIIVEALEGLRLRVKKKE